MLVLYIIAFSSIMFAGPPFNTDDPEPVEYRHWEFYVSSVHTLQSGTFSGTFPHFETNYGFKPEFQVHLLLPLNYNYSNHKELQYGYAYSEFGIKYRFISETENIPQVGTFPIIEIPTITNKNFSNNKLQLYLPIWVQKSWNKLTTYGGGGFWFNPGVNNKNWIFTGWEIQYDFSQKITLGGEIFYHSSPAYDENSFLGFNLGGFLNFTEKFHLIYSAGHNFITRDNTYMAYLGILWTI